MGCVCEVRGIMDLTGSSGHSWPGVMGMLGGVRELVLAGL